MIRDLVARGKLLYVKVRAVTVAAEGGDATFNVDGNVVQSPSISLVGHAALATVTCRVDL